MDSVVQRFSAAEQDLSTDTASYLRALRSIDPQIRIGLTAAIYRRSHVYVVWICSRERAQGGLNPGPFGSKSAALTQNKISDDALDIMIHCSLHKSSDSAGVESDFSASRLPAANRVTEHN